MANNVVMYKTDTGTVAMQVSTIQAMNHIVSDGTWPDRSIIHTVNGIFTVNETAEDFQRNVENWRDVLAVKFSAKPKG